MAVTTLTIQEKTTSSVWTDRAGASNPTAGAYSLSYTFPTGVHAIKAVAVDEASNEANSSIIVFESESKKTVVCESITDNVSNFLGTTASQFSHTNDTTPTINCYIEAADLSINGESAVVPVGVVTEAKLWMAWKPHVDPETKATINYASDAVGTHDTVGGTGQMVQTITTGFTKSSNKILFSITPSTAFLPNRIYTFGCKVKDIIGTYSASNISYEFSVCIDTANPAVTINTPYNGYVYFGNITTVTGNVSDTLV